MLPAGYLPGRAGTVGRATLTMIFCVSTSRFTKVLGSCTPELCTRATRKHMYGYVWHGTLNAPRNRFFFTNAYLLTREATHTNARVPLRLEVWVLCKCSVGQLSFCIWNLFHTTICSACGGEDNRFFFAKAVFCFVRFHSIFSLQSHFCRTDSTLSTRERTTEDLNMRTTSKK